MTDTDQTTPTPAPTPHALAALKKFVLVIGVLCVFWLIFGQVVPRAMWEPSSKPTSQDDQPVAMPALEDKDQKIAALSAHIEQLEAKLKTLEDLVTAAPLSAANTAPLEEKIITLETRLQTLEQTPNIVAVDDARFEAWEAKIAAAVTQSEHRLAVLMAIWQLEQTLHEPYRQPLGRLQSLLKDSEEAAAALTQLDAFADRGIPSHGQLSEQFLSVIPEALSHGRNSSSLASKMGSLIQIRKIGEKQTGGDDESVIARAEAKLAQGDLAASLKELSSLSPPAATSFSAWTQRAQTYLQVHQAIDALKTIAVQSAHD